MMKCKHLIYAGLLSVLLYACGSSNNTPFDHAAQAVIDKDSIAKFLKNNYYDATLDSIKPLVAGKTALINDPKLKSKNVKEDDIDYTLYYYENRVGNPVPDKGFPTVMDSVLVKYGGVRMINTSKLSASFDRNSGVWFLLTGLGSSSVIRGWTYGLVNFKGGRNATNNGPLTYVDGGKGILIIPSGLAYRNNVRSSIPANSNLIFYVELWDHVKDTDHDNDGLASILEIEDATKESDPRKVDTDKDNIPNYLDADDDNDGTLTKDEDANGDGDPRNDDKDKDGIPDYLDRDTK